MPDYSMCKGDNCNLRNNCLRFRVKPSKFQQSYFAGLPGTGVSCVYFITIEGQSDQMLTESEKPEPPRRANELETEVRRLEAIIDKLPKCWRLNEAGKLIRDVPVTPGMTVWAEKYGIISQWKITRMDSDGWVWLKRRDPSDGPSSPEMGTKHYSSTYKAVVAAMKSEGDTQ